MVQRPALQDAAPYGGLPQDQLLLAMFESSEDAIIANTLDGTIRTWNKGAADMYGYPAADIIGHPVSALCPPDRKSETGDILEKIARGETVTHYETVRQRRNGDNFPVSVSFSPLRDISGKVAGVSSIASDISGRLQASQSQARLASIVEFSHDAILTLDLDGVIDSWNGGAERLYGFSAAEAIGHHSDLFIPGAEQQDVHRILAALAAGERMEEYQAERVCKDRSTIELVITMASLADENGVVTGVSAVARDITPQQRAAARFQGLLEAAPDAMICADSTGRIVLVNAQTERLFGYRRADLEGQPVEILVPDAVRAGHGALRARYAADPQPRLIGADRDVSGRRRDGTTFPAEISLSSVDTDQGTLTSAAVRDVSVQRQARDDLRRTNRNLESLAYSIAHDLRTPLRSLAGFSTLLSEEYGEVIGETGRGYAERIENASVHMGDVLDSLMHLSRISRTEISLEEVDLGAEAADIAAELQRHDPGRRVTFAIQQPARALADPVLARTILHSLLGNAWKFTAGRDDAVIEFGMTPVADARVSCYVRDNGAGFDPAYVGKLFRPFQRLHTTGEFPGTGIGLATVREIVDRHGGRVWADGLTGHGATVSFTLQAAPSDGPAD